MLSPHLRCTVLSSLPVTFSSCRGIRCGIVGILLVAFGLSSVSDVQAQQFGRIEDVESSVSYFHYALPGQATVQISLWGEIGQTGIYEIPDSTGLDRLLSMAGGAPIEIRQKGQDPSRITVRLYRDTDAASGVDTNASADANAPDADMPLGRREIFSATMEEMLSGRIRYPILQEDDIVVVEVIRPRDFDWRDAVRLVTSIGTLTLLALRLSDRFSN